MILLQSVQCSKRMTLTVFDSCQLLFKRTPGYTGSRTGVWFIGLILSRGELGACATPVWP